MLTAGELVAAATTTAGTTGWYSCAASATGWSSSSVHLAGTNLLNHLANLNFHFTLFLLRHTNGVRVRNFFLNLLGHLDGASANFRAIHTNSVGVRNFFLNLLANVDSASSLLSTALGHCVSVRNLFLNLLVSGAGNFNHDFVRHPATRGGWLAA